jgi:UDP-glucose 4-epimerase
LRYANVYGPRQDPIGEAGVVAIFISNILQGKDCRINGDGKQTRDYVFVGDVVQANMLALASTSPEHIFNIATGKETDVNELHEKIAAEVERITKKKTGCMHGPSLPGEVARSCLATARAHKELGWTPQTTLDQGIHLTVTAFTMRKST